MRRDVLVALLVLIPVIVLVLLSLSSPGGEARGEEVVVVQPPRDAAVAYPSPQPAPPVGERESETGDSAFPKPFLINVRQCLTDQKQTKVEVHFTPTRDGRYADVRVVTQDPYLQACLEDVFEEARWTVSPSATESFSPTRHTFTAE
jgi:hypothetical protein